MSLRILGCILVVLLGIQAFPQQPRQRESSDFNYNGKTGEKTLRSLDQINLQDENIRGRNSYTDSYGNPVAYDSLDDVNAQRPSSNKNNPHQYVIPGYASGILDSQEIPSRSSVNDNEGRTTNDDKIHFVDPLNQNSFLTFNNAPSTSLTVPGFNTESQASPIEIPRPNIDLPETPISSNDDSLNSNLPNTPPSSVLEAPINQNSDNRPFVTGLVPPQITNSEGVEIPRPNLDVFETPIDGSNNLLNQGLLPPTSSQPNFNNNIFLNPKQDEPVIITDEQTVFAPKPSNGLLPPKDPVPNNFNFQPISSINNALPSTTTPSKFNTNFEGSILGGITTVAPLQIPVQVIHSQDDGKINKYTGTFGGAPGILVNNNQINRVIPTSSTQRVQPSTATSVVNTVIPTQETNNKFTGSFGGSIGLLNPNSASTTQTITDSTSTQINNVLFSSKKKPTLTFNGPQGVLKPFDNIQKN
ncbi:uncharacterized protein [Chironomus tepperi]|uniref:uncharacterized protein isoform X2 n=1 Tax=Chironomus tepperi TaxID=113505 RepID=UPI00391F0F8D